MKSAKVCGAMRRPMRLLPFLAWFPLKGAQVRADIVAGITVALVLVPQSIAYAQLAGLPPHYGLYTAFLPVVVAGLWGSSGQLATGPVAVVSLLVAATLTPLAAPGSGVYIAYAIALAFMVGCIQLALGVFRLGFVVNFLSHPVIAGFTSAAAIIIALSQLNKLLGVPASSERLFLLEVWDVLEQLPGTHLPTLAFGLGALAAILAFRRLAPRWPGVLITAAVATAISAAIGFDRSVTGTLDDLPDFQARTLAREYLETRAQIQALVSERRAKQAELARTDRGQAAGSRHAAALSYEIELLRLRTNERRAENRSRLRVLLALPIDRGDGVRWRVESLDEKGVHFHGGGAVVGSIPAGLPELRMPQLDFGTVANLLSAALVISVVGFMEAISIAKAMAARTRQRIDADQELIGQGLANLAGSVSQSFPASGSFSRSAVNFQAGARTGLASVVTAAIVLLTLLFLTPLLYHLPQAVLAAIIVAAVVSLVNFEGIRHAWRAQRHDGLAGALTFIAALALAPNLDIALLAGAGVSILLFLYRSMRPRVAVLGRHTDGALGDATLHGLPFDEHIVVTRFDGQLYFANVPYFEDTVLDVVARFPKAQYVLVVADGINQIDASGDHAVRELAERLRANGMTLAFSGLKKQVLDVMRVTGTLERIGAENVFMHEDAALAALVALAERLQPHRLSSAA